MLDAKFVQVQQEYARLKALFDAGTLSADGFESQLQSLIFEYGGRRWTIGASSGKWFASSGDNWVETAPPAVRPPLPEHATHSAHPAPSSTVPPTTVTPPNQQRAAAIAGVSEKAKLAMLRWGTVLLFVGAVSFVLPLIGMQFQLLNLFGEENQMPAAIIMIVLGGILVLVGRSGGSSAATR